METKTKYLVLSPNGDPYGRGFTATEMDNPSDNTGIYCGDIGAMSRSWWRNYARRNGYKLVEWR